MQNLNAYQGVLCMNKPKSFTSFDVIAKLRGILHMKRLGHTGTLDPMATGVLPVLVGSAAKACDILPNQNKTYRAEVRFGIETDTEDIWGKTIAQYPEMHITREMLEAVIPSFLGKIQQLPPMYSAVSVDGKRLYTLAREGITVERPTREVCVHAITLEAFDEAAQTARLLVSCGKGVYIRTLLADIGKRLDGGAVMTNLCRTEACGFSLAQCFDFEAVAAFCCTGTLEQHLIPIDQLFSTYPALYLSEKQSKQYRNGVKIPLTQLSDLQGEACLPLRVYDAQRSFLGLGKVDQEDDVLRVMKNF